MRRTTLVLRLLVPAVLIGLVGLLAALEYRWLDQVSDADRDRRRATLQRHADEFADAFDSELARLTVLLRGAQDGDAAFTRRYDAWHEQSRDPQIVRAIYMARGSDDPKLSVYDTATHKFTPAAWPDTLAAVQNKMRHAGEPAGSVGLSIAVPRDTVDAAIPAVIIPLPPPRPTPTAGGVAIPANPPPTWRSTGDNTLARASLMLQSTYAFATSSDSMIALLDRPYIESTFLPALAQRYFPTRDDDPYRLAVMDLHDPKSPRVVTTWPAGTTVDPKQADATVPMFSLRPDLNTAFYQRVLSTPSGSATNTVAPAAGPKATAPVPTPAGGARGSGGTLSGSPLPPVDVISDRVTARGVGGGAGGFATSSTFQILVETKAAAAAGGATPIVLSRPAAWQLVLQHSSGSLEAAVSSARRRNLWLSFGLLSVLAAGVVLIVSNAQRSERLATQQMDFVATVSHELRTPIAVIRSAAQNLSAGVVEDPARAKQYGELIEAEGRRLTEMVEQVLDYAGISGSARPGTARPVDLAAVAADVLAACRTLAASSTFEIESDIASPVPPVLANEHAVRSAIENLVANAIKYGADGGWLRVEVKPITTRGRSEVQITVSDRGLGIDPADLPHVFEAFYRGRRAIDAQIHGNGLGLSLVKRTIEAHRGRVTVRSEPGAGATFTLVLPAASPDVALDHAAPEAGPSHA